MIIKASTVAVLLISLILCLPPYLVLRLFARFYKRARRRNINRKRYLVGMAAALLALGFNVFAFLGISASVAQGKSVYGTMSSIAVAIAWVSFWLWLFLAFAFNRDIARRPQAGDE
ncbi:hypothetical protein [Frigidibacter sp. SD6-1]|uniref:hypothetical protein n=1 Tax=Frigidibacter sp. SD6-1 TaxID=3032581 RepID=UPI0024DFE73E|nr:hypothetical protein [Frigidibacter sp. SD6-1]